MSSSNTEKKNNNELLPPTNKNALAKLLRHARLHLTPARPTGAWHRATAQWPPKDYGIKTQIHRTAAIIFIPFPFGFVSCR
ncbi:hypothetical protein [Agriterribacter sp.]|uniref:hypothetical protein n=1 Tax=Agriterribacter sp. TaxID=2821509 RepID=UPI002C19D0B0|nr:hypothetical protein [Agriterribacter sp.]HTN06658.1 hypothetical protein [Agriterribacter sp.]